MKKLVYLFFAASLMACGSSKDASDGGVNNSDTEMSVDPNRNDAAPQSERPMNEGDIENEAWATVHIKVEGCPIQLDVVDGDLFFKAYPVNLDHEFWKEGLKVRFSYQPSKAPIPEACIVDKAIILKDVERKKD